MGREKKRQEEEKKSGHMSCKSIKGKMRILRASKLEDARGSDEATALSCMMMYTNNGSIHDTPALTISLIIWKKLRKRRRGGIRSLSSSK